MGRDTCAICGDRIRDKGQSRKAPECSQQGWEAPSEPRVHAACQTNWRLHNQQPATTDTSNRAPLQALTQEAASFVGNLPVKRKRDTLPKDAAAGGDLAAAMVVQMPQPASLMN